MASHLKIVHLFCLLFLVVLMEEVKPVLSKKGGRIKQRTKSLEASMKEVKEMMKKQEERIKALENCTVCSKEKNDHKEESCEAIRDKTGGRGGKYQLSINSKDFSVFCDMTSDGEGWTLVAQFSNNDNKNWMRDDGLWWYDQQDAIGTTTDPSLNSDMISPAFWLVSGKEFKITRSDDPSHTPLLQTTGNCLAGQTFRSKITSYGDFRNGKVWASDKCLGSCTVQYGGQYKSTDGFKQAECSEDMQSANKIGFWCDWSNGDGSVMMIGGGGNECARADHGIGITESDDASFVDLGATESEYDFGYDAETQTAPSQSYSLNLWIR